MEESTSIADNSFLQVGMGQSPEVPEHLSEEGKDFLGTCFVQNPQERATAQDLLSHNFIKVTEKYSKTLFFIRTSKFVMLLKYYIF